MYEFAVADIRLVGSELANEGRLEVKVAGIWGTICGRGFDDVDAGVACYMLGFGYVRNVKRFDFLTNRKRFSVCYRGQNLIFVMTSFSQKCDAYLYVSKSIQYFDNTEKVYGQF